MMKCPECGSKTEVKQTRTPEAFGNRYLAQLSDQWPELVCRRRHCSKCPHRQTMFLMVARQSIQLQGESDAI
jgi:transcriptional regulator NrdR family protein